MSTSNESKQTSTRLRYLRDISVSKNAQFDISQQMLVQDFNLHDVNDDFYRLFLGDDKTIMEAPAEKIALHRIEQTSTIKQVEDTFEAQAIHRVVHFSHFLSLVRGQRNGEKGDLLTDGGANIAFVERMTKESGRPVARRTIWIIIFAWHSRTRYEGFWIASAKPPNDTPNVERGWLVLSQSLKK